LSKLELKLVNKDKIGKIKVGNEPFGSVKMDLFCE
jgi:hypothetical protein